MRWSGDFSSYKRYTAAPVLTITSVFVCVGVFLFLCLFMPSVSHAFCPDKINPDKIDPDFPTSPFLYSDVWKLNEESIIDGELDTPAEWNVSGAKHLHNWLSKGAEEDIRKAWEYFMKAEERDYTPALNNLGVIHLNGWGVDEDIKEAKKYFKRASEGGYIPAKNNLGVIELREAPNDSETLDTAKGLFQEISESYPSYPPALNNLGILHLREEEYTKAIDSFKRAAEFDYAPALFNLGASYAQGYDGQQDYRAAAALYEKAARKGNIDAQYSLGLMYSQGVGVEKNLVNSFVWLDVAKEHGFAEAAKVRSWVEELLTEEEISEATSCVEKISPKIHTMDPFTLYDDVAVAPELYELSKGWIPTDP